MPARPDALRTAGAVQGHRPPTERRVGPNAILQTAAALAETAGASCCEEVFAAAGLSHYLARPPGAMVDEAEPARLFSAIRDRLGPEAGDAVLREAGLRTGDYVATHRIPPLARQTLAALPNALAVRLLLAAIERHAWTFAGSGSVACRWRGTPALTIAANPLATPGCPWHLGVLEALIVSVAGAGRLGGSPVLRHVACCARGDPACITEIAPARRSQLADGAGSAIDRT